MKEKISIILIIDSNIQGIDGLIESIKNQTQTGWVCYIIDDSFNEQLKLQIKPMLNKQFIYCQNSVKLGLRTRDKGLLMSCGEYVCFLEESVVLQANMFETLYHHLIETQADLVYCDQNIGLSNKLFRRDFLYKHRDELSLNQTPSFQLTSSVVAIPTLLIEKHNNKSWNGFLKETTVRLRRFFQFIKKRITQAERI